MKKRWYYKPVLIIVFNVTSTVIFSGLSSWSLVSWVLSWDYDTPLRLSFLPFLPFSWSHDPNNQDLNQSSRHFFNQKLFYPLFAGESPSQPKSEESSRVRNYSVLSGSSSRLPCDVSIPTSKSHLESEAITLILWYFQDKTKSPIYSLDARQSKDISQARHHVSSDYFRGRVKFVDNKSSNSTAFLILDPVLESDSGLFVCRVDFKFARTVTTATNLTVIGECFIIHWVSWLLWLFSWTTTT